MRKFFAWLLAFFRRDKRLAPKSNDKPLTPTQIHNLKLLNEAVAEIDESNDAAERLKLEKEREFFSQDILNDLYKKVFRYVLSHSIDEVYVDKKTFMNTINYHHYDAFVNKHFIPMCKELGIAARAKGTLIVYRCSLLRAVKTQTIESYPDIEETMASIPKSGAYR